MRAEEGGRDPSPPPALLGRAWRWLIGLVKKRTGGAVVKGR
jgi:hypothetical protein